MVFDSWLFLVLTGLVTLFAVVATLLKAKGDRARLVTVLGASNLTLDERAFASYLQRALAFTALLILGSALVLFFISRWLLRPLNRITSETARVDTETLDLRIRRQSENALKVASFVESRVPTVRYPFLPSHPQYALAKKQMLAGGSIFSLEVPGGRAQAHALLDALKLVDISNNIGDSRSLMCHNASTTHYSVSAEAREEMGVTEGMLRLNVGLEDPDDVIEDLDQALKAVGL